MSPGATMTSIGVMAGEIGERSFVKESFEVVELVQLSSRIAGREGDVLYPRTAG